jgi:tRNA threonylcarbamoyladenosine biosynthesis protein TsaE
VLDVEIVRATGADAIDAATEDTDADDVPDEPRHVVVSGTGARWADAVL